MDESEQGIFKFTASKELENEAKILSRNARSVSESSAPQITSLVSKQSFLGGFSGIFFIRILVHCLRNEANNSLCSRVTKTIVCLISETV